MFEVSVTMSFSAAHNLRGYRGKCEALHGHNWKVEAVLSSSRLDKLGMVADFTDIKDRLKETLSVLDHGYLNDVPPFDRLNPTSENIARFIYERMKKEFRGPHLKVSRIKVWETETSVATYFEK
jgi:6-pyruvoyltetrahydropterin/6-carboxytetrahydropterin synthase